MSKLEIVRSGFGHLGVYLNDLRIAGEKPWGGGQTIHTFTIRVDDERVRDAFASLWPEVAAERERLLAALTSIREAASAAKAVLEHDLANVRVGFVDLIERATAELDGIVGLADAAKDGVS